MRKSHRCCLRGGPATYFAVMLVATNERAWYDDAMLYPETGTRVHAMRARTSPCRASVHGRRELRNKPSGTACFGRRALDHKGEKAGQDRARQPHLVTWALLSMVSMRAANIQRRMGRRRMTTR